MLEFKGSEKEVRIAKYVVDFIKHISELTERMQKDDKVHEAEFFLTSFSLYYLLFDGVYVAKMKEIFDENKENRKQEDLNNQKEEK